MNQWFVLRNVLYRMSLLLYRRRLMVVIRCLFYSQPTEYSRLKMSWEIPRKDVRLLEQIGQGAFVEVWKGHMRRSPGSTDVMRVIIKKLQGRRVEQRILVFILKSVSNI